MPNPRRAGTEGLRLRRDPSRAKRSGERRAEPHHADGALRPTPATTVSLSPEVAEKTEAEHPARPPSQKMTLTRSLRDFAQNLLELDRFTRREDVVSLSRFLRERLEDGVPVI